LATCRLLAERGASVVAIARTPPPADVRDKLAHFVEADLSTLEGCRHAVDETIRLCGRIDIFVCNHGIASTHEDKLYETDVELFRKTMATNLEGPFYLTRFVMPHMVKAKYGRCVYTSSTAEREAEPEAVAYNTSKSGLGGLMRSVCQDGAIHGITANGVLPGWVPTDMGDSFARAEAEKKGCTVEQVLHDWAQMYPPKRLVKAEEVAHAILWLASEESSGVSGESIRISLGCPV